MLDQDWQPASLVLDHGRRTRVTKEKRGLEENEKKMEKGWQQQRTEKLLGE